MGLAEITAIFGQTKTALWVYARCWQVASNLFQLIQLQEGNLASGACTTEKFPDLVLNNQFFGPVL